MLNFCKESQKKGFDYVRIFALDLSKALIESLIDSSLTSYNPFLTFLRISFFLLEVFWKIEISLSHRMVNLPVIAILIWVFRKAQFLALFFSTLFMTIFSYLTILGP